MNYFCAIDKYRVMKRILTNIILICSACLFSVSGLQAQYRSPLDIPLLLSANFGELRPNHFHSGLDIKTDGVINKPVYAIADGYVSRILVSPSGYGLALYIDHPETGQTSLYGHLNKFAPDIASFVLSEQYKQESYSVNLTLEAGKIPVKKGQLIAYSGNTGSSGGPHVHFEIRDTKTGYALDPLLYYKANIDDSQSPVVRGIAIYPIMGAGIVNGSVKPLKEKISILKTGGYSLLSEPLNAWGKIGVGINCIDRMNKTSNIYGVKTIHLYCDQKLIWTYNIDSIDFDRSKMINSFIDYDEWVRTRHFYVKSYIENGNKLSLYEAAQKGYIDINEEREYNLRYELEDIYGNATVYKFSVTGKKQTVPPVGPCTMAMVSNQNNYYVKDDFSLIIPLDGLYTDVCFTLNKIASGNYLSDIYTLNNRFIPLNKKASLKIKLHTDKLDNKSLYGLVAINERGNVSWVGGRYDDGFVTAEISRLGDSYAVATDSVAPRIIPVQPEKWGRTGEIKIRLSDDLSGVRYFRGTVDGQFALFAHDMKSSIYSYIIDPARVNKGQKHNLVFTASDTCGNEAEYSCDFAF